MLPYFQLIRSYRISMNPSHPSPHPTHHPITPSHLSSHPTHYTHPTHNSIPPITPSHPFTPIPPITPSHSSAHPTHHPIPPIPTITPSRPSPYPTRPTHHSIPPIKPIPPITPFHPSLHPTHHSIPSITPSHPSLHPIHHPFTSISPNTRHNLPYPPSPQLDLQWVQVLSEGWASPLQGFMREEQYLQALHFSHLVSSYSNNNQSIPIVLPITHQNKLSLFPASEKASGEPQTLSSVTLKYQGRVVAVVRAPEVFEHRKEERCCRQFGTNNPGHPYVKVRGAGGLGGF